MTWEQGRAVIEQLLTRGELERVAANEVAAVASLAVCEKHIATAQLALTTDPVAALSIAYDAARKSLTAVLLAQGLRPTRRGGHIAVTDALTAQLDPPRRIGRQVDRVRRLRNANEYPDVTTPLAMTADAESAIVVAVDAVAAARLVMPLLTPF